MNGQFQCTIYTSEEGGSTKWFCKTSWDTFEADNYADALQAAAADASAKFGGGVWTPVILCC